MFSLSDWKMYRTEFSVEHTYTHTHTHTRTHVCEHTDGKNLHIQGFPQVALVIKNPSPVQATQQRCVQSLGREDPLEKGMAHHSSILAWKIPWAEEPVGLQSMGPQRVRHD